MLPHNDTESATPLHSTVTRIAPSALWLTLVLLVVLVAASGLAARANDGYQTHLPMVAGPPGLLGVPVATGFTGVTAIADMPATVLADSGLPSSGAPNPPSTYASPPTAALDQLSALAPRIAPAATPATDLSTAAFGLGTNTDDSWTPPALPERDANAFGAAPSATPHFPAMEAIAPIDPAAPAFDDPLTIDDLVAIAKGQALPALTPAARDRMKQSAVIVARHHADGRDDLLGWFPQLRGINQARPVFLVGRLQRAFRFTSGVWP